MFISVVIAVGLIALVALFSWLVFKSVRDDIESILKIEREIEKLERYGDLPEGKS